MKLKFLLRTLDYPDARNKVRLPYGLCHMIQNVRHVLARYLHCWHNAHMERINYRHLRKRQAVLQTSYCNNTSHSFSKEEERKPSMNSKDVSVDDRDLLLCSASIGLPSLEHTLSESKITVIILNNKRNLLIFREMI